MSMIPYILTANLKRFAIHAVRLVMLLVLLFWALVITGGCGSKERSKIRPIQVRSVRLYDGLVILQPLRVQVLGDTLFVSYKGIPRLDMYTLELVRMGSLELTEPEPVMPSAFVVSDSQIVVCDHGKGALVIFDRTGTFIDSYGLLPDQQTRLMPLALATYKDIAYVSDMALKQILAISLADKSNLTSRGELILQIPGNRGNALGFPSAVFVTPDGRLLVGDAGEGRIRVFTCDGGEIYDFPPVPGQQGIAPQGFALDNVRDLSLLDADSFDPSGVRELGRIHVVDGNNGVVHMFNPLGEFLASYPGEGRLDGPSDITISLRAHRIFIADSRAKQIHIFSYEGN